jgi:hypothetical protein
MTHSNISQLTDAFQKHQLAFTDWIRHPDNAPAPNSISTQRLNIYRELIFNNISSFIEHTYPVTQALLPAEIWRNLIDAFFQYGQCDSPYYYDISMHFKDFLDQDLSKILITSNGASSLTSVENLHQNHPWLRELMQYEWMELYVDMAEVTWLDDHSSEAVNVDLHQLTAYSFKLKTTCWILAYQYPVHTWSTATCLVDIQPSPTCLLIYRDQNFDLKIHTLHPLWAFFIDTLQSQEITNFSSLTALLQENTQLAQEMIDETLINVLNWLKTLTLLHITPVDLN